MVLILQKGIGMIRTLCALAISCVLAPISLHAATLESVTPSVTLRDGSIPPQPNVEIFVFAGEQFNTEYTVVFNNVTEEPASVVVLPATVSSSSYDAGTQKLTVAMKHVAYVDGTQPPGPATDFSIALVYASPGGAPDALRGSWMATNISPLDWTLIPPEATNPSFGYQISGPVGQNAFLRMFIPASMFSYISTLVGQTVTPNDMAVFSGTSQTNVLVEDLGNGSALVKVSVPLSTTNPEVTEVVEAQSVELAQKIYNAAAGSVTKKITVGREADLSLSPNPTGKVKAKKSVKLFGCVASRVPFKVGEKVALSVTAKGKKPVVARATLDAKGCYRKPYKMATSSIAQAVLAKNTSVGRATAVKSKKLSIKVG